LSINCSTLNHFSQKASIFLSGAKMVKTLPFSDIQVPSPGFGAMGLSFGLGTNLSLEQAEPVLLKAIELGCTFWDTAVSVSPPTPGHNV
jgi:hypothetical protein